MWCLLSPAAQQENAEVERKGVRMEEVRGSKWGLKTFVNETAVTSQVNFMFFLVVTDVCWLH